MTDQTREPCTYLAHSRHAISICWINKFTWTQSIFLRDQETATPLKFHQILVQWNCIVLTFMSCFNLLIKSHLIPPNEMTSHCYLAMRNMGKHNTHYTKYIVASLSSGWKYKITPTKTAILCGIFLAMSNHRL